MVIAVHPDYILGILFFIASKLSLLNACSNRQASLPAVVSSTPRLINHLVNQTGTIITTGHVGPGFIYGLISVIIFAGIVVGIAIRNRKMFGAKYQFD